MDNQDNQSNEVKKTDLPIESGAAKESVSPELSPEAASNSTISSKEQKDNNNSDKNIDMTLPSLNIENSEAAKDENSVAGTSVLDNHADFSTIFSVESEETPEVKTPEVKLEAPKVEVPKEEEEAIPVDKALTAEEIANKKELRKKNFNGEEKIIYEIKEEKEGNPLVVVFFFVALIAVILALPILSKKVSFINGTPIVSTNPNEEEQKEEFYFFNRSSVRAKIGNLEFTNFVKHKKNDKYTLTFNISNKQQKAYTFDKKYYVVFYEEEKVIYRALIYSNEAIGANAITSVEINITENSYNYADRFKIEEILPDNYPEVKLSTAEDEYRILTCTYLNDKIEYYFLDNKLAKIKETYKEELEHSYNFQSSLQEHYELSQKYKTIQNFKSDFIQSASEFTLINEFYYKDIPDAIINNLNEYKFFKYNESKDIVNFEMEAQSYNCG